ncbi:MAG: FtsX-like permease family protein [Candidatus Taylorbacteria bacterium]|nr:FtsX-like permease family protein [Candidatus Taylorbacteria bacterium]
MKRISQIKQELFNAVRVGWFLAYHHIRRSSKWTTVLIVFIMTLTLLNLVVVSGLLLGLITGSFEAFKESYSGEVIVTSAPQHDYIENSQNLISYLNNHPNVKATSVRYVAGAQLLGTLADLPGKDERPNKISIRLVGIDPTSEEALTGFSRFVVKGETLVEGEEGSILIGANMIKKYSSFADANIPGLDLLNDVDVGSRIKVTISTTGGTVIKKDFRIKGIVKSKVDEISTRAFITDKELKRLIPVNKEEVQEIAIKTDDLYAPILSNEIKFFMGSYSARIQTSGEAIPSFLRNIETTMGVLGNALSSFALVVASITIFIVVFINAVTKRKFIGIMKGIGVSPIAIEFSYIFQALFYGVVGSIVGLIITFGVLKPYFAAYPINFPFSDGILVATPESAGIRVVILLVVTLAAGYIPAKLIVRKNTLDAILGR